MTNEFWGINIGVPRMVYSGEEEDLHLGGSNHVSSIGGKWSQVNIPQFGLIIQHGKGNTKFILS